MKPWRYNQGGEIIEVIIRDASFKVIETIKFNSNDKKRIGIVSELLKRKYNIDFSLKGKDKDMEWLKQDF